MKKIFTLLLVFLSLLANSQQKKIAMMPNCKGVDSAIVCDQQPKIILRCPATNIGTSPLLVVDWIPIEFSALKEISPDDTESVIILKAVEATALYGSRAMNGVIIITTKSSKFRKFIIKDFLDGKTIPGATVKFKSLKDKNDSSVLAANDSGFVLTNKLKAETEYEIEVSSVGFKNYTTQFNNPSSFHEQTIFLERASKNLSEVVVVASGSIRRVCRIICGGHTIRTCEYILQKDSTSRSEFKIYPNPLPRGSYINIELTSSISETSSIRVFSLAGALVHQQKISTGKWKTLSIASDKRWTAGTYIVQLLNDRGKPVGQQKIIAQ